MRAVGLLALCASGFSRPVPAFAGKVNHALGRNLKHTRGPYGRLVAKDKAIKRFMIKNMVDQSSAKDVLDQSVYKEYELPKTYQKCFYCVSCAVHRRIVRVRNVNVRRERVPLFLKLQRERAEQRAQSRPE